MLCSHINFRLENLPVCFLAHTHTHTHTHTIIHTYIDILYIYIYITNREKAKVQIISVFKLAIFITDIMIHASI